MEHFDVLIVGAGVSGIAAACHLQRDCPGKSFAILEARAVSGGTWDLFRYPGVRSDSDMHTFAYTFKPWAGVDTIAEGGAILDYLREAARENGIDERIRYGHRLTAAAWDGATARWTLTVARGEDELIGRMSCRFLMMCTGYFSYSDPHRPRFPGEGEFAGTIVHPQFWPEDLDVRGKRIVVIGSGATAITLVPALAESAAQVTMLQRSPTYVLSRPRVDRVINALRTLLPFGLGDRLARLKYLVLSQSIYVAATRLPSLSRRVLVGLVRWKLGRKQQVEEHFTPRYAPWEQRLCLVPDGDLFDGIRAGKVAVVTDRVDKSTASGIRLESGAELAADIVVCATGLKMELLGGVALSVDGVPVNLARTIAYKGCMFSGIPNLALAFGYANASWTLKAELVCGYVCRLIRRLDALGQDYCVPCVPAIDVVESQMLNLNSGYVARARASLPRQGTRTPWKSLHNYPLDILLLRHGRLDDGALQFKKAVLFESAGPP